MEQTQLRLVHGHVPDLYPDPDLFQLWLSLFQPVVYLGARKAKTASRRQRQCCRAEALQSNCRFNM